MRHAFATVTLFFFSLPLMAVDAPRIISFAAVPASVRPGQATTLLWVTDGTGAVSIDNGVGAQPPSGSASVVPATRTTYTLSARKGDLIATAAVVVGVATAPSLVIQAVPAPIVQPEGTAGGRTSYVVSNIGGTATSVTLFNGGNFFSQDPSFFTLLPGASQTVAVTANALAAGAFDGASLITATLVPEQLQVPVRVFSAPRPAGSVSARSTANRIDIAAAIGQAPTGSATFTNSGEATLFGALASDVPWLVPQSGIIQIEPGGSATVTFTVDQLKFYQADSGSLIGSLSLHYLTGPSALPAATAVTVVNTVPLQLTEIPPPPPRVDETVLFIPGAGHIAGSVGTFITDLSVLSAPGVSAPTDVKLYYTSADGATRRTASALLVGGSINIADVVKTTFRRDAEIGTIQIRSAAAANLFASATVLNVSAPAGTYGTAIPVFRSDRSVPPGENLVLTGLRRDATSHTNLFIQETSALPATVRTEFLAADGSVIATRNDAIGPYALTQINNAVPPGSVAAILTNTSTSAARIVAYATPVDEASGDNWSIVDWSRQYAYSGGDVVVIPVAGVLNGANDTHFQTDVAITNTAASAALATLRFLTTSGQIEARPITLGAHQSAVINNVAGDFFGAPNGSVGFIELLPSQGTFAMTSRTYTSVAGRPATFGTGVPVVARNSAALRAGSMRAIGGISDSSIVTVRSQRPATYRTNFGLVETTGNAAHVRVTLRFNYAAGMRLQTSGTASRDYVLAPNQFLLLNGLGNEVFGQAGFEALGDLHNVEADFQVLDGDGSVVVFTSTVDNGSGDSILRME